MVFWVVLASLYHLVLLLLPPEQRFSTSNSAISAASTEASCELRCAENHRKPLEAAGFSGCSRFLFNATLTKQRITQSPFGETQDPGFLG